MNLSCNSNVQVLWMKVEREQALRVHRQRFGQAGARCLLLRRG